MKYERVKEGIFLKRPNRFIAEILIDGVVTICHVKNTGRLKELLTDGAKVIVCEAQNKSRKTKYDLIGVYKNDVLYNIDSAAPNAVFGEYVKNGGFVKDLHYIKAEQKYKNSRFDFYIEYGDKKAFVEVKGVTKESGGIMMFPDAPTQRGVKHVNELRECITDGYEAYVVFVIQADYGEVFMPDEKSHREFKQALQNASSDGVKIIAYKCKTGMDMLCINSEIRVEL